MISPVNVLYMRLVIDFSMPREHRQCKILTMASFSFDIVSDYDKAELNNVYDQLQREIATRYDFKGTPAGVEWLGQDKAGFKLTGANDYQLDSLIDMIRKKLAARGQSQKLLDASREPVKSNLKTTREVLFRKGLDQDKAKTITKLLRERFPKVKTAIQGLEVRVTSSSKDELQAVMTLLQAQDFDFPLSFTNYR